MKKITFFVAFSILLQFMALSQQTPSVISYLPKETGYLILNKESFPTVKDWIVEIQQKSTNAAGVVSYNTVSTVNVLNSYFSKLAPQYANGNYYLKVSGKNVSGVIVVTQGPFGLCDLCDIGQSCFVYCIAPTYAWRGTYTANSSGGNIMLSIGSTNNPNGSPAYQYFTPAQFAQLPSGSVPPSYYNCTAYNLLQGDKIQQMTIPTTTYVTDANGNQINGNVYAIKKYLGPWAGNTNILAQNIAADFQVICSQGASTAASIINNNSFTSYLTPNLSCNGISAGGVNAEPSNSASNFLNDCYYTMFQNLDADPNNVLTIFEANSDCQHPDPVGFNWPSNVAVVNFKPYNNPNGTIISLKENDFYSPNGDFTPPTITLQKGLYMMGIQFTDNSYATVFFESKQVKTYTYPKSNLLSAVVAPVPVVGNSFNLNLTAYSNLNFTYKLKNSSGTQIYSKQYSLSKNQTMQDQITIPNGIPAGQLFNSFVFSDGSELKFQTYK